MIVSLPLNQLIHSKSKLREMKLSKALLRIRKNKSSSKFKTSHKALSKDLIILTQASPLAQVDLQTVQSVLNTQRKVAELPK